MRVWTVQSFDVLETLEVERKLNSYGRSYWASHYRQQYQWLIKQMLKREVSTGDASVWFGWYCYDFECRPPDVVATDFFHKSDCFLQVMIELEIPAEQLLLTDFNLWHCVLLLEPVTFTKQEEMLLLVETGDSSTLKRKYVEAETPKTWERVIIDLDEGGRPDLSRVGKFDPQWTGQIGQDIQATFEILDLDQVVKFTVFRSGRSEDTSLGARMYKGRDAYYWPDAYSSERYGPEFALRRLKEAQEEWEVD